MIFSPESCARSAGYPVVGRLCADSTAESRCWRAGAMSFSASHAAVCLPSGRNEVRHACKKAVSSWRGHSQQPFLQHEKHLCVRSHAATEVQHQTPGVRHELRRPVHDLLQHRLQAPALGRMADRRNFAGQAQLPEQTQAV